jgi:hypothetical protein
MQQNDDFEDDLADEEEEGEREDTSYTRTARAERHRDHSKRRGSHGAHKRKNKGNYHRRFVNRNGVHIKPYGDVQLYDLSVSKKIHTDTIGQKKKASAVDTERFCFVYCDRKSLLPLCIFTDLNKEIFLLNI